MGTTTGIRARRPWETTGLRQGEIQPSDQRASQFPVACGWSAIFAAALLLIAAGSTRVSAQLLSIDIGSFDLPADTATTDAIQIRVNNSGGPISVGGLDFAIEIETGGPKIKSVDLLTGTTFESNHFGPAPSGSNTDHFKYFTMTQDPSKDAPILAGGLNLVATVTFDTTLVVPGTYSFKLTQTGDGTIDTVYNDPDGGALAMTVTDGSLTVVPEPAQYGLAAALGLLLAAAARLRAKS